MNVKFNGINLFSFSNFVLNSFIILFSTLNCNLTSVSIAAIYGLMQKFNILKHGHYTINQQLVLINIQCMVIYSRFSWMSFQNFWKLVKRLIYFISKFSILWLDYFNLNFLHKFWVLLISYDLMVDAVVKLATSFRWVIFFFLTLIQCFSIYERILLNEPLLT